MTESLRPEPRSGERNTKPDLATAFGEAEYEALLALMREAAAVNLDVPIQASGGKSEDISSQTSTRTS